MRFIGNALKQLILSVFCGIGSRIKEYKTGNKKHYFSINGLDQKLEKHLPKTNGFFVELGANDGANQSNTLYFERFKGWHGVLIEPIPHNYLKCSADRSSLNHIFAMLVCPLIIKTASQRSYFLISYLAQFGLESDAGDPLSHALSGRQFLESTEKIHL